MRWVQQAAMAPHKCAAVPFIGSSNAKKGFIDLGVDARERDHLYLSVAEAVEPMARLVGWSPPHVVQHYKQELEAERVENARLGAIVADLEKFKEAAEYTLGAVGQKVRSKPGRKPNLEVAA